MWDFSVRLGQTIEDIKGHEENVKELEVKAHTFTKILQTVRDEYKPEKRDCHAKDANNERRRESLLFVLRRAEISLDQFETALRRVSQEKKSGRYRYGPLPQWRRQVAEPQFQKIGKSLDSYQNSLQVIQNVIHGLVGTIMIRFQADCD